jgi:hypothetical protein
MSVAAAAAAKSFFFMDMVTILGVLARPPCRAVRLRSALFRNRLSGT